MLINQDGSSYVDPGYSSEFSERVAKIFDSKIVKEKFSRDKNGDYKGLLKVVFNMKDGRKIVETVDGDFDLALLLADCPDTLEDDLSSKVGSKSEEEITDREIFGASRWKSIVVTPLG